MKKLMFFLTAIVVMVTAVACTVDSSKTVLFSIDNGDVIELKMDTSNKYDVSTEVPFHIMKSDKEVASGAFAESSAYEEYAKSIEEDETAVKLEEAEKDGNSYLFWSVEFEDKTEYNYIMRVANSNTAVILGTVGSKETAEETFNRLGFSAK